MRILELEITQEEKLQRLVKKTPWETLLPWKKLWESQILKSWEIVSP